MVSFRAFLLSAAGVLAFPPGPNSLADPGLLSRRGSTPNQSGQHSGFFYTIYNNGGQGEVIYQNGADGSYSVSWTNCSNFVGGKGWNPGNTVRNISFSGSFSPAGNGYLSVYGYTRKPMVEYYVVESYGTYDPRSQFAKTAATIQADGGTYTIGLNRIVQTGINPPERVTTQVWSVRDVKRVTGTVTMSLHFDAWEKRLGLKLGTHDYQIVATEGYRSSGSASITVEHSA